MTQDSRQCLVHILKLAYSGELAAAHAYRGHWGSVKNPDQRSRIKQIEQDEWHHRKLVGEMLRELSERPDSRLELKASAIGRTIGFLCYVTGWLAPMYGAGKLERRNIKEYEVAARHARGSDHEEFVDCLLTMAEVEWEHEKYFRSQVLHHWLGSRLPLWQAPPPKKSIRASMALERLVDEVTA